ncbi:transmembrane protein, putative [Medicago truncatula]|uniref:Transmembrane protein, putative n=1 Tax=Medicago truncatula TaxID=3880 RepID=G7KSA4_MEDTR|nr:transmembrane protein, putative [Medicago truncatula]
MPPIEESVLVRLLQKNPKMIVNHYGDLSLSLWCRIMILQVGTSFGGATFVKKRNKMDPKRAEDLVYAHDPLDGVGIELAELSLDEPELEALMFFDDGNRGEETDTISVSS